jgi:hypothetical protein
MAAMKLPEARAQRYSTKKCPFCYSHLAAAADRCSACGRKVGPVERTGWAAKPLDWQAYLVAIVCVAAFGWFVWYAFFSGKTG